MAALFMGSSFLVYPFALKKLDISVAYPVWSGLGTAAIVVVGWLVFKENISLLKGIFIGIIVIGIAGLYLVD
jgi:small multidrug resistance pump